MITHETVRLAEKALERNIERRLQRGHSVNVVREIYYEGLTNIRCVLEINGLRRRMVFLQSTGLWRTS